MFSPSAAHTPSRPRTHCHKNRQLKSEIEVIRKEDDKKGYITFSKKSKSTTHFFPFACRRGYLIATKDEKEPEDPGKVVYTLGTRFAVDLGKKRLMRAYFATLGQDMDKNLLKEFREQDLAEEDRRKPEEDEADDE